MTRVLLAERAILPSVVAEPLFDIARGDRPAMAEVEGLDASLEERPDVLPVLLDVVLIVVLAGRVTPERPAEPAAEDLVAHERRAVLEEHDERTGRVARHAD